MAVCTPTILCISSEVRHTLLGYAKLVVRSAVHAWDFDRSMETPVLQAFVSVGKLGGTVEGSTVRPLIVDGGQGCQVHETAVSVTYSEIKERHISIAQLECFVAAPEVTGCIYHEIAQ